MRRVLALAALWALRVAAAEPVDLTVKWYYGSSAGMTMAEQAQNAMLEEFHRANPDIRLKSWSALQLPGNMWQQTDLLAFAGGLAADIQQLFFHQIQFCARQNLVAPLNDWIGEDANRDGILSDNEVR